MTRFGSSPRERVREMLYRRAHSPAETILLRTGATTPVYLDPKSVFDTGPALNLVGMAMNHHISRLKLYPGSVGGPTMGSDFLSHAVVLTSSTPMKWFSVRERAKKHGAGKLLEGGIGPTGLGLAVITDDVVDSGDSLMHAYEVVRPMVSRVAVIPLVDRADKAAPRFERLGVLYRPLLTYVDLDIESL